VSQEKWIAEKEPRGQTVRRSLARGDYGNSPVGQRLYPRPRTWPSQQRTIDVQSVGASSKDASFFERLYAYCRAEDPDAALDLMLDVFDEVIESGDLTRCDELLRGVDLKKVDLAVALGFLSATTAVKRTLPYRDELLRRVRDRFLLERDANETDRLLAPFR
jgi:hypothetical protein